MTKDNLFDELSTQDYFDILLEARDCLLRAKDLLTYYDESTDLETNLAGKILEALADLEDEITEYPEYEVFNDKLVDFEDER